MLALRGRLCHDHGACTPYGVALAYNAGTNVIGPYVLPAYRLDINWCLTNFVPCAPTRGAGRPQGMYVMERLLDAVAAKLGIARDEVRRRNMIQPSQMPYATPIKQRDGSTMTYDSGDYPECQRRALAAGGWDGFPGAAGSGAQGRPLSRPRPRQLRRGHRPRPVRERGRAGRRVGQDRHHHRRERAGPGHEVDAGAARRRRARRSARGHRRDRGRHRGHGAGLRRLRQPPGRDRRQRGASRRGRGAREGDQGRGRNAGGLGRRPGIEGRRGAGQRRAGNAKDPGADRARHRRRAGLRACRTA